MPEPRATTTLQALERIRAAAFDARPPVEVAELALHQALALTGSASGWVVERDARGRMDTLAAAAAAGRPPEPLRGAAARALWSLVGDGRPGAIVNDGLPPVEVPGQPGRLLVARRPKADEVDWMVVVADRAGSYQPRHAQRLHELVQVLATALGAARRAATLELTAALAAGSPDGLAACDLDGVLFQSNPMFQALWGRGEDALLGWSVLDLLDSGAAEIGEVQLALAEGRPWRVDAVGAPTSGERAPIELRALPLRDPQGQVCGAVIAARDTLHVQELEDRTWRATEDLVNSNRALEQFASAAARELQEPLRKILAFGEFLQADCGHRLDPLGRDYLARMLAAAERQQELLNGLLRFARVLGARPCLAPVDLGQVARDVIADLRTLLSETRGSVQVAPLPTLTGDEALLRLLLRNLVENALKFRKPDRPPVVRIEGRADGGWCELTVQDEGIGFDESQLHRMFQVFGRLLVRDQPGGPGLGLPICQRIAELHGGTISAASPASGGAIFTVTLRNPARRPPPAAPRA